MSDIGLHMSPIQKCMRLFLLSPLVIKGDNLLMFPLLTQEQKTLQVNTQKKLFVCLFCLLFI